MKRLLLTLTSLLLLSGCVSNEKLPTADEVKQISKRVADWQIEHFEDQHLYRAPRGGKNVKFNKVYHDLQWHNAAFYTGLYHFSTITSDSKYINWLSQMGKDHGFNLHSRVFHADDHAVGQFYLYLDDYYQKGHFRKPLQKQFNEMMASDNANDFHWWWCDALFMSPPVWAHLSAITGDQRYLDYMDSQYRQTYDKLWSKENSLFFRDKNFIKKHEANGESLFWARGNGWVFGGLALMIPYLPEDWEGRDFYVDLYKTMAVKIKEIQREDGSWSAGLLGDVEAYPDIETSGTSFFTFGLAWGINNGLLDRKTYEPVMTKGWNALVSAVNEDGMLTHVQGVGSSPGSSFADYTEVYGSGAFLAAGSEVYKFIKNTYEKEECDGNNNFDKVGKTFMNKGGWCWYQGPRAVISDDKLVIGGLDGKSGDVRVSVYDLDDEKIEGEVVLDREFQRDDHDAPALYVRPDGRILAMWAKHGIDKSHYYKISSPDNYLEWGDMKSYSHEYEKHGVTYMNLYYLENQKSLFSFFRDGPHFNPAYITSQDQGETWGGETHLIANEIAGRHRPYTIYSQVDDDTVGIVYTDGHPRDFGNSLYYVEFNGGKFYKADGSEVHNLKNGPLPTTHGEKLYTGSETRKKPVTCESVPNSAWNSTMITDPDGNPHIGYTLYLSNEDHRFRLSNWDGAKWCDREIAYAGRCLYYWESSYTGLMAIDPTDPEMVYISTDVDPSTGEYKGGVHEIYRARITASDDINSIKWEAVTSNSKYRNIRPIIVAKDGYKVLLWLNGDWQIFRNYDVDVKGLILDRPSK